jgi:medium-chain acyl-[acyl-carrier-protein] hydrolase
MNRTTDNDRWLSYTKVAAGDRTNVFCLPFAGGGASFYRAWMQFAPGSIAICPLQPPGREERFVEAPFDSMDALVRAATGALMPHLAQPYALFGHSMGALASFEIVHALRERGAPLPVHLFVCGAPAPQHASHIPSIYNLPEDEFLAGVQRYGGVPDEVMRSRELLDLLIPRLRADLAVTGTYVYRERPPLTLPITAFAGLDDDIVTPDIVEAWREQTTSAFTFTTFRGGHFFIAEEARRIILMLARALR